MVDGFNQPANDKKAVFKHLRRYKLIKFKESKKQKQLHEVRLKKVAALQISVKVRILFQRGRAGGLGGSDQIPSFFLN